MNQLEFVTKLNEVYNGNVQPLNRYLNKHAVMTFHCTDCGLKFFNSPKYMVGKAHQRHACNMPYGDSYGGRKNTVSWANKSKKSKGEKIDGETLADTLDELFEKESNLNEIKKRTGLDLHLIKHYRETFYRPKEVVEVAEIKEREEVEKQNFLNSLSVFKVNNKGRKAYIGELCHIYIECYTCQEVKDIDSFSIQKNSFLKRHPNCKTCQREYGNKRKKG